MGRERPRGLLKIEMSLGEEKSIWAMNLLVQTDGESLATVFFLRFKNNYLCTLTEVSLQRKEPQKKKNLTSTVFQKDFKIAKLPSMCKSMPGPSLKCCAGSSTVLRAPDTGFPLRSVLALTNTKCLASFIKTTSTFPPRPSTLPHKPSLSNARQRAGYILLNFSLEMRCPFLICCLPVSHVVFIRSSQPVTLQGCTLLIP